MPDDLRWMLLIDTCGSAGGVAVAELTPTGRAGMITAQRELPGRETQERLMSAMAEVLGEASLSVADISVLAVVTGPGSFTGTRIGLAAAKGLAETRSIPVVAVSRLAMLASVAPVQEGGVQAWIDAGRGDVFVGRYRDGVCLDEGMKHGADAVAGIEAGETIIAMEERVAVLAPEALLVPPVGVGHALLLAQEKVRQRDFAEIALLDANYLRVPDAELVRLAAEAAKQP